MKLFLLGERCPCVNPSTYLPVSSSHKTLPEPGPCLVSSMMCDRPGHSLISGYFFDDLKYLSEIKLSLCFTCNTCKYFLQFLRIEHKIIETYYLIRYFREGALLINIRAREKIRKSVFSLLTYPDIAVADVN